MVCEFAKDHPLATAGLLTMLAAGILVYLAPTVVEALGFAVLGPVRGMFFRTCLLPCPSEEGVEI